MRTLARLGVAVAATAFASATALAGAGIAAADEPQTPKPVFNSPSSVAVSGKGKATKVTYTNKSEHDLLCYGYVGPVGLISDFYAEAKKSSGTDESMPEGLQKKLGEAAKDGKFGFYGGEVKKDKSAVLESAASFPVPGLEDVELGLTDDSFAPAALTVCSTVGETGFYVEVEVSQGVGVPAGLGSLDAALTGIGSSGSVAETTGSLGS